ncbi:MAG: NifB/NifX family molybdenum-iron cluster-binding protein [Candidatus Margulisiibacteriota bacterium]|nr:NifB/NifX family molybdenum-iron cluster-binding protein [Candidatus Margulisiibacteriota bacterium]
MKICVTSTGDNLDANVDARFGRCPYFIIVDTDSLEFKAVSNPSAGASGGAGIQSAQLVANEGADAVLTGNVGPNASQTLASLGIKVYIGAAGTIKDVVQQFKEGKYKENSGPSVPGHFGTGG